MPLAGGGAHSPFQISAPTADPNTTSRSAAIPVTTGFRRIQRHARAGGETGRARFVIAANISRDVFSTQARSSMPQRAVSVLDRSQNHGPASQIAPESFLIAGRQMIRP